MKKSPDRALANASLSFPKNTMTGSIGDLAKLLSAGTEVPEEFYFVAGLAMFGATCCPKLTMKIGVEVDTRFYTVLLGDSYSVKKSTAMRKTIGFFSGLSVCTPHITNGVGSAEGLARELSENPRLILAQDELRSFLDKTKVQSSVLLPMTTSLFEGREWDNSTKEKEKCVRVRDAHLSLIGCCTTETYQNMWSQEAIAIGFPNRLLLVNADAKPKVAWPAAPDKQTLGEMQTRIQSQLARLAYTYEIAPDAKQAWERWYHLLPQSEHVKRLDTIGLRLLPLVALSNDRDIIDLRTVNDVCEIFDYELKLRMLADPIDADNTIAKLEERIRRTLSVKGPLSNRDLRRSVHADRDGVWAYEKALRNLSRVGDISTRPDGLLYAVSEADNHSLSPELSPPHVKLKGECMQSHTV